MGYVGTGALQTSNGVAPQAVRDAQASIERMLSTLKTLPSDWATKTIYVGDAGRTNTTPWIDEDGYVSWPNAEFKAYEVAWATLANHLGLVGLEYRFALRNLSVASAVQRTGALLIEARRVLKTGGVSWGIVLLAAGATWFLAKSAATKFRKVRKDRRGKNKRRGRRR